MILLFALIGFAVLLGIKSERIGASTAVAMFSFTCVASSLYLYLYFKL